MPTSAPHIFGQRDAVLVDAFLTVEQAAALLEWVAASGKNLTTIYVIRAMGTIFGHRSAPESFSQSESE